MFGREINKKRMNDKEVYTVTWPIRMSVFIRRSPAIRANIIVLATVCRSCRCWGPHLVVEIEEDDACDPYICYQF